MKKSLYYLLVIILVILLGYNIWSISDRTLSSITFSETCSTDYQVFGTDSGKGNLVGIQPKVFAIDYASEENFFKKMDSYLQEAQQANYLTNHSVVLFPEHIGTWLVVVGEKQAVYKTPTIAEGMQLMVLSNLGKFLSSYITASNVKDKTKYSLFKMKSREMLGIYHRTFSKLANKYKITIVAGSIVLPNPTVTEQGLSISDGSLYNVSVVYKPDGTIYPKLVKKIFLVTDEQPFTASGQINELPTFDLVVGKTGILICADSWYQENYEHLKTQKVEVLLVPSYCSVDGKMSELWKGYDGYKTPLNVEKNDVGKLSEEQAWLKYSMPAKAQTVGISNGLNVFLRGRLWDLGSDGTPILLKRGNTQLATKLSGATIICFWL